MLSIDRFVDDCLDAAAGAGSGSGSATAVADVVRSAVTDPTVRSVLTPDRSSYGVLHRSEHLTVLHLALAPSLCSAVHDHRMWAVVGVHAGQEDNSFFRRRAGGGLEPSGGRSLADGDVLVMGPEAIHAIRNPRSSYVSALHVYGGDLPGVARSEWTDDGVEGPYDGSGLFGMLRAARAEEDRLARPLSPDEVAALAAS